MKRDYASIMLTGKPDFVIEIISPGDTEMENMQLQIDYEQIGTKEFWIIDQPRKQVRAFFLDSVTNMFASLTDGFALRFTSFTDDFVLRFVPIKLDENILRSKVVVEFWLELDWLWQRPLPSVSDVLKQVGVL